MDLYAYVGGDPLDRTDPTGDVGVNCVVNKTGNQPSDSCGTPYDDHDPNNVNVHVTVKEAGGTSHTNDYHHSLGYWSELGPIGQWEQLRIDFHSASGIWFNMSLGGMIKMQMGLPPHVLPPAGSPIWQGLRNSHVDPQWGQIKTDGENYYSYDRRHGEIEVFNSRGQHLGTKNATTGAWEKPAVQGRKLRL